MFITARFCPFRFFHRSKHGGADEERLVGLSDDDNGPSAEQLRPELFGLGKHMRPGREVAKLQVLLFLKCFMSKLGYELVNGQVSL